VPKLQLSARELSATDVDYVSLVKRGANRLPFRIVKEDTDDMLDLARLTRVFRKADPAPAVVAAVVRKGADLDAARLRLGRAGLALEAMAEQDGLVVFRQPNVESANDALVKLDEDVGLIVSGLAKAIDPRIGETQFGRLLETEAFLPSMRLASDMLGRTVGSIMQKAEAPTEAAAQIAAAADDFKAYVASLAAALPQHALKADLEPLGKSVTVNLNLNTPASNIETSPTHGNDTDTRLTTQGTDSAIEGSPTAGNETPRNPATKPSIGTSAANNDIEGSPVAKADGAKAGSPVDPAAFLAGVEALLQKGLGGMQAQLTTAIAGVRQDVAAMGTRLDQVDQRARKAEEAVRGTVTSDAAADRDGVKKAAGRKVPPLLDTAFMKLEQDEAA
jgi:hypothetical protein